MLHYNNRSYFGTIAAADGPRRYMVAGKTSTGLEVHTFTSYPFAGRFDLTAIEYAIKKALKTATVYELPKIGKQLFDVDGKNPIVTYANGEVYYHCIAAQKADIKTASTENTLFISTTNSKIGLLHCIDLPPIITCRRDAPCAHGGRCYAISHTYIKPSFKKVCDRNMNLWINSPDLYFQQLSAYMAFRRFLRMHSSGDIVNRDYFNMACNACKQNPGCRVLIFTKKFDIVNSYIADNGGLPENLQVIFSGWGCNFRPVNPYGLPVAEVAFKNTVISDSWIKCGGSCEQCILDRCGCFELKHGQTVYFNKH